MPSLNPSRSRYAEKEPLVGYQSNEINALAKGDQITITSAPDCPEVWLWINWVYPRDGKMYVGTRGRFWLRNQSAKLTIGENAIESGWPTGLSEAGRKAKTVVEIITTFGKAAVFTLAGFFTGPGNLGESGDKYDYFEVRSHIIFEETESGTTFYTLQGKAIFKGGPSDVTVSAGNKVNIVEGMVGQPVTFSDDELDQSYLDQPWCSAGEVLRDGECVPDIQGVVVTGWGWIGPAVVCFGFLFLMMTALLAVWFVRRRRKLLPDSGRVRGVATRRENVQTQLPSGMTNDVWGSLIVTNDQVASRTHPLRGSVVSIGRNPTTTWYSKTTLYPGGTQKYASRTVLQPFATGDTDGDMKVEWCAHPQTEKATGRRCDLHG